MAEQHKTNELSKLDKEASNLFVRSRLDQGLIDKPKETVDEKIDDNVDDKLEERSEGEKWEKMDQSEKGAKQQLQKYYPFNFSTEGDPEKELAARCLRLLMHSRVPLSPPPVKVS